MADEQSGSPLRRWRPFYGAFTAIDEAIEATGHPRAAFRDARVRIVVLLRGAAGDDGDGGVAEQLCAALDDAMAEALQTLRLAPVPRSALASTGLASAVAALGNHGSPRIRCLADDVVRGWRAAGYIVDKLSVVSADRIPRHQQGISTAVADGNARESVLPPAAAADVHKKLLLHKPSAKMLPAAAAAAEVHEKLLLHKPPAKMLPASAAAVEVHKKKLHIPPAKMLATATGITTTKEHKKKFYLPPAKPVVAEGEKMETAKRKLHEGYQEAEMAKRQRIIQKIDDKVAAKMFEQKQQKMRPIMRAKATCRTSSGVRRSLLPSLQMI